jgi:prolyl-tRNA synthetase
MIVKASHDEALQETLGVLDIYAEVAEDVMAVPVIKGAKTQAEKFAGALRSYSIEAMMQNGLALQAGTSHDLGQNFGKAFDVQFQSNEGKLDYVWQTSWGVSTRLIGGLIMTHSDDRGLVLPPKVAPQKGVLVPIFRKDEERAHVMERATKLAKDLGAHIDTRDGLTPGAKFFHWKRRGVPVVFELGPRDVASTEGQHRARQFSRRSQVDPQRRDSREGWRKVCHGALERQSAERFEDQGIQGQREEHPLGG